MRPLTVFSWGFWGWGNATKQLVAAVDAAEKARGFKPPMFVDVRIRRSGRARGFKEDTFEKLLGRHRYRWMKSLGNESVVSGANRIQIAYPSSVRQLLDLALDAADRKSRVIFFCACKSPWGNNCHRHKVADRLLSEARKRRIYVEVQEWPGGRPSVKARTLRISPDTMKSAQRGNNAIPLERARVPTSLVGLPWGSLVRLESGREAGFIAAGPAQHKGGHWVLPRIDEYVELHEERDDAMREAARQRRTLKLDARSSVKPRRGAR